MNVGKSNNFPHIPNCCCPSMPAQVTVDHTDSGTGQFAERTCKFVVYRSNYRLSALTNTKTTMTKSLVWQTAALSCAWRCCLSRSIQTLDPVFLSLCDPFSQNQNRNGNNNNSNVHICTVRLVQTEIKTSRPQAIFPQNVHRTGPDPAHSWTSQ